MIYADWYRERNHLCDIQDRTKFDHELPVEFVRLFLCKIKLDYFIGEDRILRSYVLTPMDRKVTALEAFDVYGDGVEDAREYGSFGLKDDARNHS